LFISLFAQRNEPKKGQPDHIGPAKMGLPSLFKNRRALQNSPPTEAQTGCSAVLVHFFEARQSDDGLNDKIFF
jgi:hypothetical protein